MRTQLVAIAILVSAARSYADDVTYQRPVKAVARFVDAAPLTRAELGPDRATLLLITPLAFPTIAELSAPEVRMTGARISARNRAVTTQQERPQRLVAQRLELLDLTVASARPRPIAGVPDGARIGDIRWSPSGAAIAFTVTEPDAIRLWLADLRTATARPIATPPLSGVPGAYPCWAGDRGAAPHGYPPGGGLPAARGLVCRTVVPDVKPPPAPPSVPAGQIVQENLGSKKPATTNPELLSSPTDERMFEYYMTSQLALVTVDGKVSPLGPPGLYRGARPS